MSAGSYYVYLLANERRTAFYVGVTNNIIERIHQHKTKIIPGFTKKYNVNLLVYYEVYGEIGEALYREKRLKKWNRAWKERLIRENNPQWNDLYAQLYSDFTGSPPARG